MLQYPCKAPGGRDVQAAKITGKYQKWKDWKLWRIFSSLQNGGLDKREVLKEAALKCSAVL